MNFVRMPIRRRLTLIILATSIVTMLLMRGAFFAYDLLAFRKSTVRQISTLGEITAANCTAALAFDNQSDATEILATLAAEKHIVAASLYDKKGRLFARYPEGLAAGAFPGAPGPPGYGFVGADLEGFQPVVQGGSERLGTLFIRFDTQAIMAEWIRVSLGIGAVVMALVLLVAYLLSRRLQRQISQPILSLAETARAVSEHRDYTVRAPKAGQDEIGMLTDAFNQMLDRIQGMNRELEQRVYERTAQLEQANVDLDRNRAELKDLFESLPGLYVVMTPDYKVVAVSDAYLKATAMTREKLLGRDLLEAFPDNPDDPHATGSSNLRSSFERVRRTGKSDSMAILKYDVRGSGGAFEVRYWSPINSPVLGADKQVKYIIHRVEDVTDFVRQKATPSGTPAEIHDRMERMEAEIFQSTQKIEASNRQLEAANKELEAFSYSVSHDLRAPLRHIDGFAGMLSKHAEANLDDKSRRYISTISGAAKKMGRLIDDLLAFSRAGRTELTIGPIDQNALVEGVIRDGRFNRSGEAIEWRIDPLPRVEADSGTLRQVWSNLIENAVKYSGKAARPRVEIGCKSGTDGTEHVFYVRDNGVGFDMQYVDKLFGVFQRLHAVTEFEGTGIGLANVRRIIARHGGRTWAEGAVGAGATFFFTLPAVPAPAKGAEAETFSSMKS